MALIKRLDPITRNAQVQKEVQASYNVLVSSGEKYVQINTYGSSERQEKGVVSQTLQINKEAAVQLVDILRREFNI